MRQKIVRWAILPICGLLAQATQAALIDDFSVTQSGNLEQLSSTIVGVADSLAETGLADNHVATTTRFTSVTATTLAMFGLDAVDAVVAPAVGVLDYASTSGASGTLLVDYTVPLGGAFIDLTTDLSLLIEFLQFDPGDTGGLPVTALISDGTATQSLTKTLLVAGAQPVYFPLAGFTGDAGLNLAAIQQISFEFDASVGKGADFRVREITSEDIVPEPGTLVLLGLGAAALFRRRAA